MTRNSLNVLYNPSHGDVKFYQYGKSNLERADELDR